MTYTNFDDLPLVLSVDDIIDILGIGRNTAYELLRSNKIRSVRCGHSIRIPKDALSDFLYSQK